MACLFSQVPAHRRFLLRMLLLPCVLGEFRTQERGDEAAKQIIGLPDTWPELAGGNSNAVCFWIFTPKIWGRWTHFDEISIFFNWVETNHPTGLKVLGKTCGFYGPTSRTCWMFKLPHLQCMFLVSLKKYGGPENQMHCEMFKTLQTSKGLSLDLWPPCFATVSCDS